MTLLSPAGSSRSNISKSSSKRQRKGSHKPPQRPTRLNKVPLSGIRVATSRALSLQAKDVRIGKKRSRSQPKVGKPLSKLGNLADALPPTVEVRSEGTRIKKHKPISGVKSLKPRPGMQKRRAVLEKNERERFGLNLAILASAHNVETAAEGPAIEKSHANTQNATKWAALRRHIAGNLIGA